MLWKMGRLRVTEGTRKASKNDYACLLPVRGRALALVSDSLSTRTRKMVTLEKTDYERISLNIIIELVHKMDELCHF